MTEYMEQACSNGMKRNKIMKFDKLMTEHITHKINSLRDENTLCGISVKERSPKDYMTLFQLNITCPECRRLYERKLNEE